MRVGGSPLPGGGGLPDDVWRATHRAILRLLWLHVPGLFLFALVRGEEWQHGLVGPAVIAAAVGFAQATTVHRRRSTLAAWLGLMMSSAVVVHLAGGAIEAHFHFFVVVAVISLYQDWRPFLLAIAFVLVQHGVIGVVWPEAVYGHAAGQDHPWTWAAIHAAFILAAGAAAIANWKLNDRSQRQLTALAAIVESSGDAIYGWDRDGTINSWNQGAAELFGYRADEAIGRSLTMLVSPDRQGSVQALLDRVLRGEHVDTFDTDRLRNDGTAVEVSVTYSSVRNADGSIAGGATIARDIGERKRNEWSLRETLSLLGATFESTSNGILVVDNDGHITNVNSRFVEMWRLPDDLVRSDVAAVRRSVLDQLEDPEAFLATVCALDSRPEAMSDDTLHFKDGREFHRSSRPLRVDGTVVGRVWSYHDVTDRKRLEAALSAARDKAVEASRLKSEFLATMSHEIRTPMNGVIGLTGLLLETELSDVQRQYADGARASAEALLGIINDILDFSKIEAGKLELEAVDFDLADAVDEVASLIAGAARAKNLELIAYCLPDAPRRLRGDVGRIRQILLNLLANAVKFTAAGEVVLRAGLADAEPADDALIRFEVADTGIGIDDATATRLFQPFSQADASTTRRYGGTGLGLAICRRLAAAMGGEVGLESEPGRGSTFWVEIPLARAAAAVPELDSRERPLPGLRVLVVDDSETNRIVLAGQLLTWDIRADVAPDASVALDRLREAAVTGRPYDLMLVDMAMPRMDGLELARIVSADPGLASVRMLLLTSTPVGAETAAQAGFADRLTKPARRARLYDALRRTVAPVAGELPARPAASCATARKGRLLVVEDNAINQAVAKGLVAALGYACDVAANGFEALEALGRRRYDAVLMDCQMPEMDGYAATAEIRRREGGGPRVPIIAMTASTLAEDRERCLLAGMDDYVAKPVKRADLGAVVARWLPGGDKELEPLEAGGVAAAPRS